MLNCSRNCQANISAHIFAPLKEHRAAWMLYREWFTVWYAVMVFTCIGGAVLNLLLLLVIKSTKRIFSGSEILVTHLVLCDLYICVIGTPFYSVSVYFAQTAPLGVEYCRYAALMYMSPIRLRYFLEMFLSFNRFIALLYPHHYPKLTKKSVIFGMIAVSWAVIIFEVLSFFSVLGSYEVMPPFGSCGLRVPSSFATLYIFSSYFALVLTGLLYLVAVILFAFKRNYVRNVFGSGDSVKEKINTTRRVRTMGTLFAAFCWRQLCFLPAWIVVARYPALLWTRPTLQFYFRALYLAASAINPVRMGQISRDELFNAAFHSSCSVTVLYSTMNGIGPMSSSSTFISRYRMAAEWIKHAVYFFRESIKIT